MLDPQKIWNSSTLPTLPTVAVKLLDCSRDPEVEMSTIIDVIKTDPAICAKILQSTNSSFFGFSSKVTSIDRAVPLLGTTVVTSLALSFSLASDSVNSGPLKDHYRSYWKQSIIHAVAGEMLSKHCEDGLDCEFFLAGLMMDIGRLALLKTVSREYFQVVVTAESQSRPLHEVEQEFLGLDHAHVSHKLMENWGFPEQFMNGVKYQHASEDEILSTLQPGRHSLEAAMVLANAVGDYFVSPNCGPALQRIRKLGEHHFKLDEEKLQTYLEKVRERLDQAGDLFSIDMSDLGDPSDLMAQANQQLLELTMRAHAENAQIAARQEQIEQERQRLQSQNEELQEKVTRDPLTGVFNRAYFDKALNDAINHSRDRYQPVGVIFTDIDKFKSLNDTYGHHFGDQVLKTFAKVVAGNMRSADVLARYGGEEFVILVSRPTEKGIEKLAERIRATVEKQIIEEQGTRVSITASFGAALMIPGRLERDCAQHLLQTADEAMYESKRTGRNRTTHRCLFSEQDRAMLKEISQAKFSRWLVSSEILDIPAVSRALLQVAPDPRPLGEIAMEMGILELEQSEAVVRRQDENPESRFGKICIEENYLTSEQVNYLLAWQTEPPQRLMAALTSSGLFTEQRCQQLFEQYLEGCPLGEKSIQFSV
ncbi:HDOD domain-containing protein [bacterium]|nr:HDOD domain-containing protein [bacterium]